MKKIYAFTLLAFVFCSINSFAQQKAFPTAEGAGSFVTGGRGTATVPTTVFEVTNLGDVNAAGSLRYALTAAATYRTVVFRVSGIIRLTATLNVPANTTIAGQTAPGYGICIADKPLNMNGNNIIIRYIRCRLGDRYQNGGMVNGSGDDDAISDNGHSHKNIIVDHVTAGWSDDESLTFYGGDSLTIQNCFITEPLNFSYHFETGDANFENHGYGGIWGGKKATFHHNLLAHCQGRMPRFNGSRGFAVNTENAAFVNNVLYDWGSYNNNGGEGGNYNIINNYYKYGPSTSTNNNANGVVVRYEIINPYKQTSPALPYGKYYLSGNYVDGSAAYTARNWLGAAMNGGSYADTASAQALVPFDLPVVTTQSATDAYTRVLQSSGCSLPRRDTLDDRIANDVINRTGRIIDVQGGYAHGTPFTTSYTAWPVFDSLPAPADTDHDGMPDEWETQRGLNPANAADRNGYTTNGYSNIENYLNGDSIVALGIAGTCVTAKPIISVSSNTWLDVKDSSYSRLVSTDTMNVIASIYDNSSYGTFNASYFVSSSQRYGNNNRPYLNRNITIVPTTDILQPVTVRLYITQAELNALKAVDNSISTVTDLRILQVPVNNCMTTLSGAITIINPTAIGVYGTYQNGYYLEFTTSAFGTFFISSAAAATPLPLSLLSFNATFNGKEVTTQWATINEVAAKTFSVERSADGQSFAGIGTVNASNAAGQNRYAYADKNPLQGLSYYRLKIIDKDGSFRYSNTIPVNTKLSDLLAVYPNPAAENIIVTHPQAGTKATIELLSVEGKKIAIYTTTNGAQQTTIDISKLSKGTYTLLYNNNDKRLLVRFIKK